MYVCMCVFALAPKQSTTSCHQAITTTHMRPNPDTNPPQVCLCDPIDHSLRYFRGHEKNVQCFAFIEANKYIATGGQERTILLWNPYTMRRITSLQGHLSRVQGIVFNASQNHIISVSVDKEVVNCVRMYVCMYVCVYIYIYTCIGPRNLQPSLY